MGGVHHQVGEVAVVGQQQQALAVPVQAAHGEHPGGHALHQVHNGFAAQLIAGGGDKAAGLVEHIVIEFPLALDVDALAVHRENVLVGVHFVTQSDGMAVDLDAALPNDLFGCPAGAKSLFRQHLLNAFLCHSSPCCSGAAA